MGAELKKGVPDISALLTWSLTSATHCWGVELKTAGTCLSEICAITLSYSRRKDSHRGIVWLVAGEKRTLCFGYTCLKQSFNHTELGETGRELVVVLTPQILTILSLDIYIFFFFFFWRAISSSAIGLQLKMSFFRWFFPVVLVLLGSRSVALAPHATI